MTNMTVAHQKITLTDVNKTYDGRPILKNLSCEIGEGLTFVIGDSGQGKSTLLNILGTLETADSGKICVMQYELHRAEEFEQYRAEDVGFVFQDFNLISGLSVIENIELAVTMSGKEVDMAEIDSLLEEFNVRLLKHVAVEKLSGGEKQRVSLVRALAKRSKIILADEPTGNLDTDNTETVFSALKKISCQRIVVVITHNKEKAIEYADTILELKDGNVSYVRRKDVDRVGDEAEEVLLDVPLKQKQSRIHSKYIKCLAVNSIRKYKGKFLYMVLALAFAFMLVGVTYVLKTAVSANMENMNTTYYNLDEIDIYPVDFSDRTAPENAVGDVNSLIFSAEDIATIGALPTFAEIVPYASDSIFLDGTYTAVDIKPIKRNDYFEKRIMTDAIEGDFPKNKNEVIIGKDLAESLFGGDAIGKTWILNDQFYNVLEVRVVGIHHQSNVDGIYFCYFPYELLLEREKQPYSELLFLHEKQKVTDRTTSLSEDATGYAVTTLSEGEVIYGTLPTSDNEIVVSVDMMKEIAEEGISSEETFLGLSKKSYYLSGNKVYEIKIVGVHDGMEEEWLVKDTFCETLNKIGVNKLECYVKDTDDLESLSEQENICGFSFYSYYSERFELVMGNGRIWNYAFMIILALVGLISILIINSFAKISISEKTYELGILKSMGASCFDIRKVLLSDNIILGICAGLLSGLLFAIAAMTIPPAIGLGISNMLVCMVTFMLLLIAPCVLCYVVSNVKVKRIEHMKPLDALRAR